MTTRCCVAIAPFTPWPSRPALRSRGVTMSPRLVVFCFFFVTVILFSAGLSAGLDAQSRAPADDSLAIVVNRGNPVENLSFSELRKIFLGEQTHWSNGRRITVVMLEPGNAERQAVLVQIYKMGEKDFINYFLHGMFTGEIHAAPRPLPSSEEVLKFVLNVPGAIGYVKAPNVNDSVKVVRVESRLPSEKDYLLRLHGKQVVLLARQAALDADDLHRIIHVWGFHVSDGAGNVQDKLEHFFGTRKRSGRSMDFAREHAMQEIIDEVFFAHLVNLHKHSLAL